MFISINIYLTSFSYSFMKVWPKVEQFLWSKHRWKLICLCKLWAIANWSKTKAKHSKITLKIECWSSYVEISKSLIWGRTNISWANEKTWNRKTSPSFLFHELIPQHQTTTFKLHVPFELKLKLKKCSRKYSKYWQTICQSLVNFFI